VNNNVHNKQKTIINAKKERPKNKSIGVRNISIDPVLMFSSIIRKLIGKNITTFYS
jgi:hypothetical protein